MNRAEVMAPSGTVDPEAVERIAAEVQKYTGIGPEITVREWKSRLRRHEVLYHGPMRFEDVKLLGHDKPDWGE